MRCVLAKYIPAESVALYLMLKNLDVPDGFVFVAFALLLLGTPAYLLWLDGGAPRARLQAALATVAFLVWSYGIGGGFWATLERALSVRLLYPGIALWLPAFSSVVVATVNRATDAQLRPVTGWTPLLTSGTISSSM